MDWLRDWIMQIAGVIVLGVVCDMIMTEGEIKKYVKMVVGLVLIFVVINPVLNITPETFAVAIPQETRAQAVELKDKFDVKQQEMIFGIYRKKLQESVEKEIYSKFKCDAKAEIKVEEVNDATFGNITELRVKIGKNADVQEKELREMLQNKFEVSSQNIRIEKR